MHKTGNYFYSKFKNSQCRTFGSSKRNTWGIKASGGNPGPGYYRIPSDFGYYESRNAQRMRMAGVRTSYSKKRSSRRSSVRSLRSRKSRTS